VAGALTTVDDLIRDILGGDGDSEADGPAVGSWIMIRRLGGGAGDAGAAYR